MNLRLKPKVSQEAASTMAPQVVFKCMRVAATFPSRSNKPEVWTLDSKWCRWQYFSLTSWILGLREVQQDCLHSSEQNTGAIAAKVLRLKQWTLQPLVILWLRFGSKPVIKTEPLMLSGVLPSIQWPWLQDCVQIRLGSRCFFQLFILLTTFAYLCIYIH